MPNKTTTKNSGKSAKGGSVSNGKPSRKSASKVTKKTTRKATKAKPKKKSTRKPKQPVKVEEEVTEEKLVSEEILGQDEGLDQEMTTDEFDEDSEPEGADEDDVIEDEEDTEEDEDQDEGDEEESTEDIQDDFFDLYKNEEGDETVDMTTLERKNNTRTILTSFTVIIVVLSFVAAALGYLVFGPNRAEVGSGEVTLELETVERLASGDQLELTVTYTNNTQSTIDSGALELVFTQGFYFRSSDPQPRDATTNKWDIAGVQPGTSGTIVIIGQLVGQTNDQKEITALLTYTPENFSSDFQESAHTSVVLDESIIEVDTNVIEQARSGEEIQYIYSFTNN